MTEFASAEGTERYRRRLTEQVHEQHFRRMGDLYLSSIGLGTYLGAADTATDGMYEEAILRAVALGCNVLDTAVNYRCQRSERAIGRALSRLLAEGKVQRDEILIATKGGFLAYDETPPPDPWAYLQEKYVSPGIIAPQDIIANCHCIAPAYLQQQLDMSLKNLNCSAVDVYYLHNPETQLDDVPRKEFNSRMRAAFGWLEENVRSGKIRAYGLATWSGFLASPQEDGHLSLEQMVLLAKEAGGEGHHFKVIQLPYHLKMPQAHVRRNQRIGDLELTVLEAAVHLGLYVMTSAPLAQRHLLSGLSPKIERVLPGLETAAQRAIQFVRSTPGVGTALVGMQQAPHVEENLKLARMPLAGEEQLSKILKELA